MKLKTSFINRGILLNDLKRFSWIGAGYLLLLLAVVPLKVFMLYSRAQASQVNYTIDYLRIFQFDSYSPTQVMLMIIVPVAAGLLLFRYLQDGRAADAAHALPVRRETLYSTHVLAGLIFLFVPLFLTALVSWTLVSGLGIEGVKSANVFTWLSNSLLINLLFFICSVAVGMITGMTALQGAFTYILLLVPSGLSFLLLHNLNQYLYGFALDYYLPKIEKLSPLVRIIDISYSPIRPWEIVTYLGVSIALYLAGRSLYMRRNSETAGSAISFPVLRPVFKYSATFCFMLLLGSYFNAAQQSVAWTYFGYLIGSLPAYFLIEILLNKSLQVFQRRQIMGYGAYALVMVVLLGLFHFDWTGYEKRLPQIGEIKSVYMDYSFYPLSYQPAGALVNREDYYAYAPVKAIYTDQDNINHIYALHQQIINNQPGRKGSSQFANMYTQQICLAYELTGGKRIYRQYKIIAPDYADSLKPVYQSREHKELHNAVFNVDPAGVDFIEITGLDSNKNLRLIDPEAIEQAFTALKSDIFNETYEEIINADGKPPWATVYISVKDYSYGQDWKKSYVYFPQWLKDTGNYERARLLPGVDVTRAFIDRVAVPDEKEPERKQVKPRATDWIDLEARPGILEITDQEQLEWCLSQYFRNGEHADYEVFFVLKSGAVVTGYLGEAGAPDSIRRHFIPEASPR